LSGEITVHRVILAAGVAILVTLAIILARSQGGAAASDTRSASVVSNRSEHWASMRAAASADLHGETEAGAAAR
jgi:hypothetical protein